MKDTFQLATFLFTWKNPGQELGNEGYDDYEHYGLSAMKCMHWFNTRNARLEYAFNYIKILFNKNNGGIKYLT
jgi:hypothetical protein